MIKQQIEGRKGGWIVKIEYKSRAFRGATIDIIDAANRIINEYAADGMNLTVRQLYYQFIAHDLLPESWIDPKTGSKNNPKAYGKISSIISSARLAGLIDWELIVDKTRGLKSRPSWETPGEIIEMAERLFKIDRWKNQDNRVEVWIEKEALTGVIDETCRDLDVPYFACKGFVSQSEMWKASQRFIEYGENGQNCIIIHLGDHDPSGIDMTRDIEDRQSTFFAHNVQVHRIALNFDQVEQYNPPPNPAKMTDTRAGSYISRFGGESWELDALEPRVIRDLVRDSILMYRNHNKHLEVMAEENVYAGILERVRNNWRSL